MANLTATALLVAFLLVSVATADGRTFSVEHEEFHRADHHFVVPERATTPLICTGAHGVEAGETCDSIARRFHAGLGRAPFFRFVFLNPNINCRKLFVGQWVCIQGLLPV
uniref:LysM domain-containing protein n=1 Tax=Oryza punctata TaxID=4537 RepID=A0A0E0JPK3_ORYPU